MLILCSLQASITSLSFIEPPGCITDFTPFWANLSRLSLKGKNASEASTDPFTLSSALINAISTESTLDICPAPIPKVTPSLTKTIAFDLTCLTIFQANSKSLICSADGFSLLTVSKSFSLTTLLSKSCSKIPPTTFL